jgi:hypothetical protein
VRTSPLRAAAITESEGGRPLFTSEARISVVGGDSDAADATALAFAILERAAPPLAAEEASAAEDAAPKTAALAILADSELAKGVAVTAGAEAKTAAANKGATAEAPVAAEVGPAAPAVVLLEAAPAAVTP